MADEPFHFYDIPPMDFGWNRLDTVKAHARRLAEAIDGGGEGLLELTAFLEFVGAALDQASRRRVGPLPRAWWEGDFREGCEPRVVVLPNDPVPALALVWKQENNGTTFIVSEVPMDWLDV